jgi:hypothetical protein
VELTAEIFLSLRARLRRYLIQELSSYQPLQASSPWTEDPASPTAHMLERPRHGDGTKSPDRQRKSFPLLDVLHPLAFAANVQVTTITLLPLQHSHLEPSFSDFLESSMCSVQTVDLHCCNIDHRAVLIYSLLEYLSLPLKCFHTLRTPFEKPLSVSSHGHISIM